MPVRVTKKSKTIKKKAKGKAAKKTTAEEMVELSIKPPGEFEITPVAGNMNPHAHAAAHNAKFRAGLSDKQKAVLDVANSAMDEINDVFETQHHRLFDAWCRDNGVDKVQFVKATRDLKPGTMTVLAGKVFYKRPDEKVQEVSEYIRTLEKNVTFHFRKQEELANKLEKFNSGETTGFWRTIRRAFSNLMTR